MVWTLNDQLGVYKMDVVRAFRSRVYHKGPAAESIDLAAGSQQAKVALFSLGLRNSKASQATFPDGLPPMFVVWSEAGFLRL